MTAEERAALKALVDRERRERIKKAGCYSDCESEERSQRTRESAVMRQHALALMVAMARVLEEAEKARDEAATLRNRISLIRQMAAGGVALVVQYETDEDRQEARRRTWRESKRRATERQSEMRYTA